MKKRTEQLQVLVLGIGNLLMNDDAAGVMVVNRLKERFSFPDNVTLFDGGTLGLDILPYLEGVDRLLVVDAVETGEAPGTLVRLTGEEIPLAMATKVSPHQMGLKDLLLVAELQGNAPKEMVLWGIQPGSVEMDMELSRPVSAALEILSGKVVAELAAWGVHPLS